MRQSARRGGHSSLHGVGRISEAAARALERGTLGARLPEGYTEFVSTVAPAWEADGRPIYGAFFWINRTGRFPIPEDAYRMSGAGGQRTFIIPSHDLVVVRLGHYKGEAPGDEGLKNALTLLMEAVPESRELPSN